MLTAVNNKYSQSTLLNSLPHVVHGYSFRSSGDMRLPEKRDKFLQLLHIESALIMAEQVHGTVIENVRRVVDSPIPRADGMIVEKRDFNGSRPCIGVIVADCVPLLFADRRGTCVAVAHAGWKGTLGNIASLTVQRMLSSGSDIDDIYVSMGPHIGMCCYDVPDDRVLLFPMIYRNDPQAMSKIKGCWHMDIGYMNMVQLMRAGISKEHIDAVPTCTSCQFDRYYSYRKDTRETFGEILGVISFRSS